MNTENGRKTRRARSASVILVTVIGVAAVSSLVHEYTHVLAGWALGIPVSGPDWSGLRHLMPTVEYDVAGRSWKLTVAWFSGGVVSGATLLSVYLFLRGPTRKWRRDWTRWGVGLVLGMGSVYQLCLGLVEGLFHYEYLRGGMDYALTLSLVAGLVFHEAMTRWRLSKALMRFLAKDWEREAVG